MSKQFIDYYRVLGVTFEATEEQIKRAYRNLARRLHPDCYPEGLSKEREEELRIRFTAVTEAYEVLGDAKKRKEYDVLYIAEEEKNRENQRRREERRREQQSKREEESSSEKHTTSSRTSSKESKDKSFTQKIKDSYNEIIDEERKIPFKKRHRKLERMLDDEVECEQDDVDSIIFSMKKGVLHVFYEFIFQLSKLTYINEDTVTKYVIRNRRTLAAVVLAGTLFSVTGKTMSAPAPDVVDAPAYTTVNPTKPVEEENTLLTRLYKVRFGDTLSGISAESNTTINTIKKVNGLDSNTIYEGQILKVPYYIKNYELDYYIESVSIEGKTLVEIAEEYETDLETIYRLNSESIIKTGDRTYQILSDTINVPKFITREEFNTLKENAKINH